jgi:hypothetical protein
LGEAASLISLALTTILPPVDESVDVGTSLFSSDNGAARDGFPHPPAKHLVVSFPSLHKSLWSSHFPHKITMADNPIGKEHASDEALVRDNNKAKVIKANEGALFTRPLITEARKRKNDVSEMEMRSVVAVSMGTETAAHFATPTIKTKYQRLLKSADEIKKLKEKHKKLKTEEPRKSQVSKPNLLP